MTKERKRQLIIVKLRKQYPHPKTALDYRTPFQLLVAVILSAQCTDKKVNEVTRPIFVKYKTAKDFTAIPLRQMEKLVKQTGFYKMKAKAVSETAKTVLKKFNNNVPLTIDELTTLRGVARKTANVVIGQLTGKAEGIAVDTHVKRLSQRLDFTNETDPKKIEQDLMQLIPKRHWVEFPLWLINHGRAVCIARRPKCDECTLNKICPSAFNFPKFKKR